MRAGFCGWQGSCICRKKRTAPESWLSPSVCPGLNSGPWAWYPAPLSVGPPFRWPKKQGFVIVVVCLLNLFLRQGLTVCFGCPVTHYVDKAGRTQRSTSQCLSNAPAWQEVGFEQSSAEILSGVLRKRNHAGSASSVPWTLFSHTPPCPRG